MTAALSQRARELFNDKIFAVVATIDLDGRPQLSVVWCECDGDAVVFSTVAGRRKHRNLVRDPRCTILVNPPAKPYSYVEVRGSAEVTQEGSRELIDRLARKYRGEPRFAADDGTDHVRVVVRVVPDKVIEYRT